MVYYDINSPLALQLTESEDLPTDLNNHPVSLRVTCGQQSSPLPVIDFLDRDYH